MDGELSMEFQLSQARLRAVIATLSVICGVAVPFFGFLGYRYVENMDEASAAIGRLTTEMAVLNTQAAYLREDIADLKKTVRTLQERASKALYVLEGEYAKTHLPTTARIGAKIDFGQAWGASTGVHGFSNPEGHRQSARELEVAGVRQWLRGEQLEGGWF